MGCLEPDKAEMIDLRGTKINDYNKPSKVDSTMLQNHSNVLEFSCQEGSSYSNTTKKIKISQSKKH